MHMELGKEKTLETCNKNPQKHWKSEFLFLVSSYSQIIHHTQQTCIWAGYVSKLRFALKSTTSVFQKEVNKIKALDYSFFGWEDPPLMLGEIAKRNDKKKSPAGYEIAPLPRQNAVPS